jgi:hypothetical protein
MLDTTSTDNSLDGYGHAEECPFFYRNNCKFLKQY